jgi:hypothetical protein
MASRQELNIRARNVGIDPASYPNDSKLEQRVIYEEKNSATETGALAVGTLTSTGTASADGNTVKIGEKTYTFKTNLTEAKSVQTLTGSGVFSDGEIVAIGDRVYTMKTALSSPAIPGEVLIGADLAASLDNLKLAINGGSTAYPTAADASGAGSTWATGTERHEEVIATTNADTTQIVQAINPGTAGNNISVSENAANASWGASNLAGGVNPVENEVLIGASAAEQLDNLKLAINRDTPATNAGVKYSSNTAVHDEVTATTNTDTTQVVQAISYDSGETIDTTDPVDVGSRLSWGATKLASGTPKVVASVAADNQAISGGARV